MTSPCPPTLTPTRLRESPVLVCALTGPSISHPLTDSPKDLSAAPLILLRLAGEPPAHIGDHGKELCDSCSRNLGLPSCDSCSRQLYRRRLVRPDPSMHSSFLEAVPCVEPAVPLGRASLAHYWSPAPPSPSKRPVVVDDFAENITSLKKPASRNGVTIRRRELQSDYWSSPTIGHDA